MKKLLTKALGVVLSLAVAASFLTPTTALAADNVYAPKNVTIYLDSTNGSTYDGFYVSGLTKKQTIKKSSVKTGNKKVAALYCLEKHHYTSGYNTEFFNDKYEGHENNWEDYEYYIGLELKKTGTSEISYKVGSKKYTTTVDVKKYTNPLKSVKITGINSGKNIASKLKNQNSAALKLKKDVNDAVIKLESNKGWKITNVYISTLKKQSEYNYRTVKELNYYAYDGESSVKFNVGDLKKKGTYEVTVVSTNTKNGARLYSYYNINY